MVVDRYKGYSVYRLRESFYRVLESKEIFQVFDERTGKLALTLTAYYNPKRILRPADKEAVLNALLQPALAEIRRKIDAGDLTDHHLHLGAARDGQPTIAKDLVSEETA